MIRRAVVADAPALAEVHITTWQFAYRDIFGDDFLNSFDHSRRERWWRRTLEDGAVVHVADDDGVVGFCFVGPSNDEGWGEVYAIYVHPDSWGAGHGFELLRAGKASLRDSGFERALLWVLDENERGRWFYERQGWTLGKPFRVEEIGGTQVTERRYETSLDT